MAEDTRAQRTTDQTHRVDTGEFRIKPGGQPGHVGYPQKDGHTWGEFAGLAIELGGYSDVTLVDPYSGSRFWFQPFDRTTPVIDWMIQALQVAKAANWPDSYQS